MVRIRSKQRNTVSFNRSSAEATNNRMSWPQFYQRTKTSSPHANLETKEDTRKKDQGASSRPSAALERVLCPDDARVMQRATQIVM